VRLMLLSGGSGKRLWPLSNESRSKQFVKVLGGQEESQSMLQRVWGQLSRVGLSSSTVIATGKAQTDTIMHQLNQRVPLIIEPARRDTFPAVALSAAYFRSQGVDPDEVITILPVDPYVEDRFFEHVTQLEDVLRNSGADLALIGVQPTYPSAKYGYIIPRDSETNDNIFYRHVKYFKEKPTEEIAESYIEQGALWNCGVFAFRLGYLVDALIQRGYPTDYDRLIREYDSLPNRSFDYEIIESADKVVVHPYEGYWKDLGTWNTLTEEMSTDIRGKGRLSSDSVNSHIVNELDIPILVLGLSNIVVAASPDGILVTDKSASPRIKDVMGGYEERPMYEERRWGWYRVLDYAKHDAESEVLTKRVCVLRNRNSSYQVHAKRDEVWTFTKGSGEVIIDNRYRAVRAGDVCHIPAGTPHAIRAETDLEFIEVQSGSVVLEEDCERLLFEWQDILRCCKNR